VIPTLQDGWVNGSEPIPLSRCTHVLKKFLKIYSKGVDTRNYFCDNSWCRDNDYCRRFCRTTDYTYGKEGDTMKRTNFRARQLAAKLMLRFAGNAPVEILATESFIILGERHTSVTITVGIIHRVEREDGSGLRWNVTLVEDSGEQTTLFFDCTNPHHNVQPFQYITRETPCE